MKNELTGADISEEALGIVAKMANEQIALESEIEIRTIELAKLSEKHKNLSERLIPDKMLELGLSEIRLTNGAKLTVTPFYSAKIPDDMKDRAFSWLALNHEDGIIKCEIHAQYDRGQLAEAKKIVAALKKKGLPFELDQTIHHSTLKAFVRERIEGNKPIPRDLFGVYVGNKTTVKV